MLHAATQRNDAVMLAKFFSRFKRWDRHRWIEGTSIVLREKHRENFACPCESKRVSWMQRIVTLSFTDITLSRIALNNYRSIFNIEK